MKFSATKTSIEELVAGFENIIPAVEEELSRRGFDLPESPPELPFGIEQALLGQENSLPLIRDVTDLTSDQMAKLFSYYTNWANYAESVATDMKLRHAAADRERKIVESALKIYYAEEEKKKSTLLIDYVRQDPRWKSREIPCLTLETSYKKAELQMNTCRRMIRLISREQSRRGEVMQMEGQENAVGKSPRWKKKF
jgi:hypothetical protein